MTDQQPVSELQALREATRVNMPDPDDRTMRIVGFKLPEEVAWPRDGTAHDILQVLLDAITRTPSQPAVAEDVVERVARTLDPGAWRMHDLNNNADGYKMSFLMKERVEESLAKARTILAVLQPLQDTREADRRGPSGGTPSAQCEFYALLQQRVEAMRDEADDKSGAYRAGFTEALDRVLVAMTPEVIIP